jgi:hypothetical protein
MAPGVFSFIWQTYRVLRLEAFKGLILAAAWTGVFFICVAKLQVPNFHFWEGSGEERQYFPLSNSWPRSQPSHCSITGWQDPPLNEHPLGLMKVQATPDFTVEQTMLITPFH